MSKILFLIQLLLINLALLTLTPKPILATATCASSGITYAPNTFSENSGDITIKITVSNNNTLEALYKRNVQLVFGTGILPGQEYKSDPFKINSNTSPLSFDMKITDSTLKSRGTHSGSLHWTPDANLLNSFTELCSGIVIQVGSARQCTITSLKSTIPLKNPVINVSFFGTANTNYTLYKKEGAITIDAFQSVGWTKLADTSTNPNGIGNFQDVKVPGNNGDSFYLVIVPPQSGGSQLLDSLSQIGNQTGPFTGLVNQYITDLARDLFLDTQQCRKQVTISATASESDTDNSNNPSLPCTDDNCSKAGGDPCDDARGPGFKTAIGCIHTTPKALVEDVLKFATGIGGGLAFMMMLLGAFQMLTSGGNPQNLQGGRDVFQNAIIGLLFIIFSILLMKIIGIDILSIPGFS